jgi:hypothetical protein
MLRFSHHSEVAALPPAQADALLDKAAQTRLSRRDLRQVRIPVNPDARSDQSGHLFRSIPGRARCRRPQSGRR